MNGKLTKALLWAASLVAIWWVGTVQGAADRVPILESRVGQLEKQLDRIESKLDRALGVRNGSKGDDGLRVVPGPLPEGQLGAPRRVP